jgi:hypothetical protein
MKKESRGLCDENGAKILTENRINSDQASRQGTGESVISALL